MGCQNGLIAQIVLTRQDVGRRRGGKGGGRSRRGRDDRRKILGRKILQRDIQAEGNAFWVFFVKARLKLSLHFNPIAAETQLGVDRVILVACIACI